MTAKHIVDLLREPAQELAALKAQAESPQGAMVCVLGVWLQQGVREVVA